MWCPGDDIATGVHETTPELRTEAGKNGVLGCFCSSAIPLATAFPIGRRPSASEGARWEAVTATERGIFDKTATADSRSGQAVAALREETCARDPRAEQHKSPGSSRVSLYAYSPVESRTLSRYVDYLYLNDTLHDPEGDILRTLRGGAWNVHRRDARVSYRTRNRPGTFNGNIGVRVVVGPVLK